MEKREDANHAWLYLSTANEVPKNGESAKTARSFTEAAVASSPEKLLEEHRELWHQFYGKSFLSVPDRKLETFFWIQLYKLGSAMAPEGPVLDCLGPWMRSTAWPWQTWDLNALICYWPVYASNHLKL
jgi:hypothetical protein